MNRKMSRYKGLILSCMSVIMIVVCVCSFSIESKAENIQNHGEEFYVNYAEPAKSASQGYINILTRASSGRYCVNTFYWTVYAVDIETTDMPVFGKCILGSDDSFAFTLYSPNASNSFMYTLYEFNADGDCRMKKFSSDSRYETLFSNEIVAWKAYGNAYVESAITPQTNFSVYYSDDGSSVLLMDILSLLAQERSISVNTFNYISYILDSVQGIENQLASVIDYLNSIETELEDIGISLDEINNKYDDLLKETKKQTSWLEKIWNSIQEFINPSDEDKEDSEKIEDDTTDKKDALDELNEENKTEKTDVEDASEDVDENVDLDTIGNYGTVLSGITENEYVIQILLLVFSVAFVSYVLFGKK